MGIFLGTMCLSKSKIEKLLSEQEKSWKNLSKEAGVSKTTFIRHFSEMGQRSITLDTATRVSDALGVSIEVILERRDVE